jgi:hypothetical protein
MKVSRIQVYSLWLKVKYILWLMLFQLRRKNVLLIHSLSHFYIQFCCSDFLIVNGVWLEVATMNTNVWEMEGMINLINNAISIFIFVLMSQMIIVRAGGMDDTGQVR